MPYRCPSVVRARLVGLLLAGAVSGAGVLGGCTSALSGAGPAGSSRYTDGLIARALTQGSTAGGTGGFAGSYAQLPTIPGGVTELARVDSAGPDAGRALAQADTAVVPAGGVAGTQPGAIPVAPAGSPTPQQPEGATGATAVTPMPLRNEPLGAANSETDTVGLAAATLNQAEQQFNLSLQDAIARALKNNLDIKVDAFNPGIRENQIIEAEAAFDPVVFGQSQWANTDEPLISSGFVLNGQSWENQVGIRRLLPTGATVQAAADVTYRDIYNGFGNVAPGLKHSYTANLNLQVTQPLFRGFGADVNLANVYLAQRDRSIALATFKRTVITNVANVEEAYHNLVLARSSVEIQQQLLTASEQTAARVRAREGIDADAIAVSQSVAAVEARRATLIRAFAQLRSQSDRLKNLLNDPELNIRENLLINPTDRPTAEPIVFSTADAITTALQQRTELTEARLQVERADIIVQVSKNDLLPKVDLTASVQTNGLDNSLDQAFTSQFNPFGNFLDFRAGFRVEFPLGNRQGEAEHNRRKLERQQAIMSLVKAAQTVVLDVKLQLRDMLSSYQEIQARERARVAAARELQAITQKELIVALTPEFLQLKLDSQSRLAQAEQDLIQSMVNYNLAIMRLEQAKGTLLEFDRISLDRAPITRNGEDVGKIRFLGQTFISGEKPRR
jgi:outer membrane protein TolC